MIDDIQSKTVNSIDSKCSLPMTLVIKLSNIDRKIIATAVYFEYLLNSTLQNEELWNVA